MRVRESWLRGALLAVSAAAAIAGCAGPKASQQAAAAGPAHPEVDTGLDTCFSCHQTATPKVAAQWRDGRHGMSLVECVVCHGSTGADFKARPQPTGCRGCHPVQAASVTRDGATPSCFGCHPAHALRAQGTSPHGVAAKENRP
jgi:hypothetical protein